jgi:PAS domain S-box-containing protein
VNELDRAFEAGASDYITKPIHWGVLRQRIRRILRGLRAEDALRESERRLDLALKGADLGLWDWGISNRTFVVNDRWVEMLGYLPDEVEVSVSAWFDFLHPDDVKPTRTRIDQLLQGDQVRYEAEFRMQTKNGGWRWILARGRVVERDDSGRPSRAAGTHLDITERRLADQALRDSEERFRQVVASISDHLYMTEVRNDGTYNNQYVSPNIEKLLGYPAEKIMTDWDFWANTLIHPDDRELARRQLITLSACEGSEIEYRMIHRDGSVVWVRDSTRVKCTPESRIIYGVVSDITARKRAEEALHASQKLAGLGTLAAGVAHEINSPLQVITGVSQGLLNRLDQNRLEPDFLCRKLDVIHRNGWRCAEIVRSLKTYSHTASTRTEPSDLNEIVKDTLLLIEHQLTSWAHIEVSTDLAKELPALECDRNQIAQVLINLLNNAKDVMPDGGKLSITTGYSKAEEMFLLQVADNGPGMSPEIQAKIFDPFFTTKSVDQGVGLGLSIVSGIVKAHGGQISVQSSPGGGTTFSVTLPAESGMAVVGHQPGSNGAGRFDESIVPAVHQTI